MNTRFFYLLIIQIISFFVLPAFIGCTESKQNKNSTNHPEPVRKITYSNLLDKETQEELAKAMTDAGISPKNIVSFLQNVNQFNLAIEHKGLVEKGFFISDTLCPCYDEAMMQKMWDEKYPDFLGFNCRITSFDLLRDFVTVEHPAQECPMMLVFDEGALDNCGRMLFSIEERKIFRNLFSNIPTSYGKDINEHLTNVRKNWQSKGIRFIHKNDPRKASLISIVMHSAITPEESMLFFGHTGVLIPFGNKLLFIEKLAFQEPYQAIIFDDRTYLNDYLMNKYDVDWDQPTASPFLMENDELLEGYRMNPVKKHAAESRNL